MGVLPQPLTLALTITVQMAIPASPCSMAEFLNKYRTFTTIVPFDKDRNERFLSLERSFEVLSDVYRTFDVVMSRVFLPDEEGHDAADDGDEGGDAKKAGKSKRYGVGASPK